jgi:hypothetical protein
MPDDPQTSRPDGASGMNTGDRRLALDAARGVLRTHGPNQTTLKWVARESNLGFEEVAGEWADVELLLSAVLDDLADRLDAQLVHDLEPFDDSRDAERTRLLEDYILISIRAILDGVSPARAETRFPLMEHLVEAAVSAGADERTARYRICHTLILEWGWRLFGEHLLVVCGLEHESMAAATTELHAVETSLRRLPLATPDP